MNQALAPEGRHIYAACLKTPKQDMLAEMRRTCDSIENVFGDRCKNGAMVRCMALVSRPATVMVAYSVRKYCKTLIKTPSPVE